MGQSHLSHSGKIAASLVGICVLAALLGGCAARVLTAEEVSRYIEHVYGKDYELTPVEAPETDPRRDARVRSRTWKVVLHEDGREIAFELRNFLANSVRFLDGASFGPVVSRFESTYAIGKAKAVHDQVLRIVAKYPDVDYVEDDNARSDRFEVRNSNFDAFIACIQEIDAVYSFPQDTVIRFFATVYDRNDNVVDSWLYNYSTGQKRLDTSRLRPK